MQILHGWLLLLATVFLAPSSAPAIVPPASIDLDYIVHASTAPGSPFVLLEITGIGSEFSIASGTCIEILEPFTTIICGFSSGVVQFTPTYISVLIARSRFGTPLQPGRLRIWQPFPLTGSALQDFTIESVGTPSISQVYANYIPWAEAPDPFTRSTVAISVRGKGFTGAAGCLYLPTLPGFDGFICNGDNRVIRWAPTLISVIVPRAPFEWIPGSDSFPFSTVSFLRRSGVGATPSAFFTFLSHRRPEVSRVDAKYFRSGEAPDPFAAATLQFTISGSALDTQPTCLILFDLGLGMICPDDPRVLQWNDHSISLLVARGPFEGFIPIDAPRSLMVLAEIGSDGIFVGYTPTPWSQPVFSSVRAFFDPNDRERVVVELIGTDFDGHVDACLNLPGGRRICRTHDQVLEWSDTRIRLELPTSWLEWPPGSGSFPAAQLDLEVGVLNSQAADLRVESCVEGVVSLTSPVIALFEPASAEFVAVSLSGSGFGEPGPGARVEFSNSQTGRFDVLSEDPRVVVWRDEQVVVRLDPLSGPLEARVQSMQGRSCGATAEVFELARFDTTRNVVGHHALPGDLRADPQGRVFMASEFFAVNLFWDPADQEVHPLYFPLPDANAAATAGERLPFRWCREVEEAPPTGECFEANGVTQCCTWVGSHALGEGIAIDSQGRAWLTHGGGATPAPPAFAPNHSQVVMYDLNTGEGRIYPLPGDAQLAYGIAWDETRGRLWVNVMAHPFPSGEIGASRIISFDPENVCYETFDPLDPDLVGWDFSSPLNIQSRPNTVNCDYPGDAQCVLLPGNSFGYCGHVLERRCQTRHDCVLVEQLCPAPAPGVGPGSVADTDCYHEYPLPGSVATTHAAPLLDGSVWFNNAVAALPGQSDPLLRFAGRSIGRLDPSTGEVLYVPLASALDGRVPFPWDLKPVDGNTLSVALLDAGAPALVDIRDPANCQTLTSMDPADDCELKPDPNLPPPPSCRNACVLSRIDPAAWTPCAPGDELSCSSSGVRRTQLQEDGLSVAIFNLGTEPNGDLWYSRGVLRRRDGQLVPLYFPPLAMLFTSPNPTNLEVCQDFDENPTAGLGEGLMYDSRTQHVWSKNACAREIYRLTPSGSALP